MTLKHFATVDNKDKFARTNIYIYVESGTNINRYIVKCFQDGYKVNEEMFDNDEDALRFSLEFVDSK